MHATGILAHLLYIVINYTENTHTHKQTPSAYAHDVHVTLTNATSVRLFNLFLILNTVILLFNQRELFFILFFGSDVRFISAKKCRGYLYKCFRPRTINFRKLLIP